MTTRLADALADRYRIEREVGQGGMATVYLAHDIRHDRDVAVKVLHPDLGAALGSERFLTEIRTTARPQHPHILPLLDSGEADGLLYYVMPLVTGETLRARLEREKQLPIDDAILIAGEVADALGYAHGHGVIHRDIKPENILLQGGHALVADFGIALAVQTAGGQRMTQTGLSLGTPQYMSPEQAMGERTIDARSDIYSLSAVAYEMLIGEAPFTGPTVQAIVARVMSEDPRPLITQRKSIPDYVDYAILRGLDKLPADRWPSANEFAEALKGKTASMAGRTSATRMSAVKRKGGFAVRLRDPLVLTLGAIALVSTGLAAWKFRTGPPSEPETVVRFGIPAIESSHSNSLGLSTLSISPDGQNLVYVGKGENGREQLMIRNLGDVTARPLPGTENAGNPIFSPDGKWVAFVRGNQLFKIAVDGGRVQLLGTAPGTFNGASWSSTGNIVVSGNIGLFLIPDTGGEVSQLGKPDPSQKEVFQDGPIVLDSYKSVVYSSWPRSAINDARLAITSLETGKTTVLNALGAYPLGVIDGVLVYVTASGSVMGVKIDVAKRRLIGSPVQLVTDVAVNAVSGLARASLSRTGTLFYQTKSQLSKLVIASRGSAPRVLLDQPGEYSFPRLSPDGKRVAVTVGSTDRRDIWLYEISSGTMTRLTTDGKSNDRPEWSPDGEYVLYRSDREVQTAIWRRPADLSGPSAEVIGGSRRGVFEAVMSPDARYLAYQVDTVGADLFYRALSVDTTEKPISTSPTAIETMPRISPDGRWIAFLTDESGTNEVVVQPFPGPGGRVQVSAGGGTEPVWSRDGMRLFYRSDSKFISARVNGGSTFSVAGRDTVFTDDYVYAANPHANYDVLPDGEHFLFLKPASEGNMIVAANWGSFMRARMDGKDVH
ncbi:MAG: protein kinase [Gemmatimonadaceae bacterium]